MGMMMTVTTPMFISPATTTLWLSGLLMPCGSKVNFKPTVSQPAVQLPTVGTAVAVAVLVAFGSLRSQLVVWLLLAVTAETATTMETVAVISVLGFPTITLVVEGLGLAMITGTATMLAIITGTAIIVETDAATETVAFFVLMLGSLKVMLVEGLGLAIITGTATITAAIAETGVAVETETVEETATTTETVAIIPFVFVTEACRIVWLSR
jgi:hypothetical protein